MSQIEIQEKPVEYTIQVRGSDGNSYTANLKVHRDWLWKQLGIKDIATRIEKLESRIDRLEAPVRQQKILDLLKNEPLGRTWVWIERRVTVLWEDRGALLKDNRLEHFMIGNSHKYRVKVDG